MSCGCARVRSLLAPLPQSGTTWRGSRQRTPSGWLRTAVASLRKAASFFLGPALWLPLLALRGRDRAVRFALSTIGLVGAGVLLLLLNAYRYVKNLGWSGFSVTLGVLVLSAGLSEVFGVTLPLFAICLVVVGASMVLRPLVTQHA